jgi:hypothetical protein
VWDSDKVMNDDELYFNAVLLLGSKVSIERIVTYACPCSPKTVQVPKYVSY